MKTIEDIFEMLDLFYANKHLYQKIIKRQRKYERKRLRVKDGKNNNSVIL